MANLISVDEARTRVVAAVRPLPGERVAIDAALGPVAFLAVIAAGLLNPLAHPRPIGLTVLFTAFLLASYIVLYTFARLAPEWDAEEPLTKERLRSERMFAFIP